MPPTFHTRKHCAVPRGLTGESANADLANYEGGDVLACKRRDKPKPKLLPIDSKLEHDYVATIPNRALVF